MKNIQRSAGIGVLASMRTFQPPAWFVDSNNQKLNNFFLFMGSFEFAFDKMPFAGKRIRFDQFTARVISGVLTAIYVTRKEELRTRLANGLTAAFFATAGTYSLYHLRKNVCARWKINDGMFGVFEDSISLGLGKFLSSRSE
jgi:uncharacterized membrane protein